jgi:energy-coupling factor transporter transmembrane protein EcfT
MQESYMQVLADQNRIKLDPRTKIVTLLIINVSAFTVNAWYVMALAAAIPVSLFVLKKQFYLSFFFTIIYSFSLVSYVFLIDSSIVVVNIIVGMLTGVINRMGPGFFMGYYLLTTTTVSEFIASMERIRLPKQIIIPLSVMFRFFPTIKEESSSINDAMRMRGIRLGSSRGGPINFMEYRLVPLFISCVKIGEELSCSALTRGLGSPLERTNICKIGFRAGDFIYFFFSALLLLLLILKKGI